MPEPMHKKHRSKQDYETPEDFLTATLELLDQNEFRFDYAASANNGKASLAWTEQDDSLSKSPLAWARMCRGGWGWLNPPYTNIGAWTEPCARAKCVMKPGQGIAMLVPAGVGSNWYRDHVYGDACVLFLNGRLTFVGSTDCYPKDCLLILWSPDLQEGHYIWTWPKDSARNNTHDLRRRLAL